MPFYHAHHIPLVTIPVICIVVPFRGWAGQGYSWRDRKAKAIPCKFRTCMHSVDSSCFCVHSSSNSTTPNLAARSSEVITTPTCQILQGAELCRGMYHTRPCGIHDMLVCVSLLPHKQQHWNVQPNSHHVHDPKPFYSTSENAQIRSVPCQDVTTQRIYEHTQEGVLNEVQPSWQSVLCADSYRT